MNTKRRKSDSIGNESNSKIRNSSYSKKSPKKQIRVKKDKSMYVGIDLHKKFLQVATMNNDGKILQNIKVENTHESIRKHLKCLIHTTFYSLIISRVAHNSS